MKTTGAAVSEGREAPEYEEYEIGYELVETDSTSLWPGDLF